MLPPPPAGPCHCGTSLKSAFTITAALRYEGGMMLMLAAAAAATAAPSAPPRSPAAAMVQARATVRIIAGARLHLGDGKGRDGFVRQESVIRTAAGTQAAQLIEFE